MLNTAELGSEYELDWPPEIFQEEGRAILMSSSSLSSPIGGFDAQAHLLLVEAFVDSVPAREFVRLSETSTWGVPNAVPSEFLGAMNPRRQFLQALVDHALELPKVATGRPYWLQRNDVAYAVPSSSTADLRTLWVQLAEDLIEAGYLSWLVDEACVDGLNQTEIDAKIAWQIERRTGIPGLWPLPGAPSDPNDDLLLTVMEVFDDLVARPRQRTLHDFNGCGWHHQDHAKRPGRAIYRWELNLILNRVDHALRLATSGEDAGRLVRHVDDPRDELVERVVDAPDAPSQKSVEHAIALFRKRNATREDKRSACVALALILEDRRKLVERSLLKRDESMLYELANKWDIRHRDGKQYNDYGEEFQEWVFWNYLAAVELTNKLLLRITPNSTTVLSP